MLMKLTKSGQNSQEHLISGLNQTKSSYKNTVKLEQTKTFWTKPTDNSTYKPVEFTLAKVAAD